MAGTLYCTVADVLALVSPDAQARMATDPAVAVVLSAAGDGWTKTFDTPFLYATTITTSVAGTITASTISHGTGCNGVDQVTFATAPAVDAVITAQADFKAINRDNLLAVIADASDDITGYLSRYGTLTAEALNVVRPRCVFLTRYKLRQRRNQGEYDPMEADMRRLTSWLEKVATGQIALPATTPTAVTTLPVSAPAVRSVEASVFEAPYSTSIYEDSEGDV